MEEGERALSTDCGGADGKRKPEGGGQKQKGWAGVTGEVGVWGDLAPPGTPSQGSGGRAGPGGQGLASGWLIAWEWGSGSEAPGLSFLAAYAPLCARGRQCEPQHMDASQLGVSL